MGSIAEPDQDDRNLIDAAQELLAKISGVDD
jgi:hypothetical protein